jgi:hypothetical protein
MMTPVNRLALALFEVAAPQDASGRRNRTRQRWESAGYPVVGSELLGSRYLSSEQIDQVARWSELLAGLH